MKIKKLLLILLIINLNANAQQNEYEDQNEKKIIIKNNISEKSTFEYDTKGDSIKTITDLYDKNGNKIERLYHLNKNFVYKIKIEYNNNNLIKKVKSYSKFGTSHVQTYKYDSNNNCILNKSSDTQIKQLYNDQNQVSEVHYLDKTTHKFYISSKYYYNNPKILLDSVQYFSKNGEKKSTHKRLYANDNLMTTYSTHNNKISTDTIKYTYDSLNRKISMQFTLVGYKSGEIIEKTPKKYNYKYDSDDNLISETYYRDGQFEKIKKYFYKKHKQ